MKKISELPINKPLIKEVLLTKATLAEIAGSYIPEPIKSEPSKFFSKLFESREMAHVYHLQVRGEEGSYAAHKALNNYYDEVIDMIDNLIEVYQGQYDIINNYDIINTSTTSYTDKIDYFAQLAFYIKDARKIVFNAEDTHLHNLVDEIVALIYSTLYKLKYNK